MPAWGGVSAETDRLISVTDAADFSANEMMIVAAARALAGKRVCFVGVGLPNIAVNLARRTVAPELELVYEAGVFGARPARLPLSIGDPTIVTNATAVTSMFELFGFYLQGGLIDVAFLGGAQIDGQGNLNTTVIGDYGAPKTRLPGSGGACEIAQNARDVFVIMRQSLRSFVPKLDFRTSVGARVSVVVTDKAVFKRGVSGSLQLDAIHPGVTLDEVRASMGWEPRMGDGPLTTTAPPNTEELRLIREELDPQGVYTK
jgi:glutaconate CoA-transferase subunit B